MSRTRYRVSVIHNKYETEADEGTPIEAIWRSQKCWFGPGVKVLIEDDKGNSMIFVKGEKEEVQR